MKVVPIPFILEIFHLAYFIVHICRKYHFILCKIKYLPLITKVQLKETSIWNKNKNLVLINC